MAHVHDEGWVYLSRWPKFGQVCLLSKCHHLKVKPIVLISHVSAIVGSLTTLKPSNANVGPINLTNGHYETTNFWLVFATCHLNNYWIL
jgi:hypothetical protein